MKLLQNRNVLSGLMFMAFGAAFFIGALNYSVGSGARMGPGYFPRMLGGLLFVLGVIIAFNGSVEVKKGQDDKVDWHVMPSVYLLGSVGVFGALLVTAGLFAAVIAMVVISSLAAHDKVWKEVLISAFALATFCSLAFVKGLGLQMKLFPWS